MRHRALISACIATSCPTSQALCVEMFLRVLAPLMRYMQIDIHTKLLNTYPCAVMAALSKQLWQYVTQDVEVARRPGTLSLLTPRSLPSSSGYLRRRARETSR